MLPLLGEGWGEGAIYGTWLRAGIGWTCKRATAAANSDGSAFVGITAGCWPRSFQVPPTASDRSIYN